MVHMFHYYILFQVLFLLLQALGIFLSFLALILLMPLQYLFHQFYYFLAILPSFDGLNWNHTILLILMLFLRLWKYALCLLCLKYNHLQIAPQVLLFLLYIFLVFLEFLCWCNLVLLIFVYFLLVHFLCIHMQFVIILLVAFHLFL